MASLGTWATKRDSESGSSGAGWVPVLGQRWASEELSAATEGRLPDARSEVLAGAKELQQSPSQAVVGPRRTLEGRPRRALPDARLEGLAGAALAIPVSGRRRASEESEQKAL